MKKYYYESVLTDENKNIIAKCGDKVKVETIDNNIIIGIIGDIGDNNIYFEGECGIKINLTQVDNIIAVDK